MGVKKLWAKSGGQPDWVDIEGAMRAIDGIHLGKTGVLISPRGIGGSGGFLVSITTAWDVLPGSTQPALVESESSWPCAEGCTFEGHILGGLYAHDYAIGEAYQQRFLIGA